jgi:hypothetical protein
MPSSEFGGFGRSQYDSPSQGQLRCNPCPRFSAGLLSAVLTIMGQPVPDGSDAETLCPCEIQGKRPPRPSADDIAIVLAADMSGSINQSEAALEREGHGSRRVQEGTCANGNCNDRIAARDVACIDFERDQSADPAVAAWRE